MARALAATPLREMDAGWRSGLASLPGEERKRLAAEADPLFRGERDDRRRALHCWLALRGSLDPADPADAPRIQAVLLGVPPGLEDYEDLARRAEATGTGDLLLAATIARGRYEADRGETASAEARFRRALAAVRGTGTRLEFAACSSLGDLWRREDRTFESLVLSRRLADLAAATGEEGMVRYALVALGEALAALGEWRGLGETLSDFEKTLEGRPLPFERTLRFFALALSARRALATGDAALAESAVAEAQSVEAMGRSASGERRVLLLLGARIEEAAERWTRAEELLREAREAPGPRGAVTLGILLEIVRCRLREGGLPAALPAARELLDVVEREGAAVHGSGRVMAAANGLATLLGPRGEDSPEVRRALDAAAGAVLLRILEIERCQREIPELARVETRDRRILQAHHARSMDDHRVLLFAVRERIVAEGRLGGDPLAAVRGTGPFIKVCAWCSRVHGRDDAWVPVGHLIPFGPDIPVTHGICPDCARTMLRSL